MKNYFREIAFGVAAFVFGSWLIFRLLPTGSDSLLPKGIAILILTIAIARFTRQTIIKKQNLETGAPAEDEFTKLAKAYAGNQAFLYSMYLWLLIFVFNSSFTKHETMLGIGILGSTLIYGLSLWHFRRTGEFNEK